MIQVEALRLTLGRLPGDDPVLSVPTLEAVRRLYVSGVALRARLLSSELATPDYKTPSKASASSNLKDLMYASYSETCFFFIKPQTKMRRTKRLK